MNQESIEQLTKERNFLYDRNAELADNLNHAVHLCYNIIKGFYPILGLRTKAVVDLCKLAANSDFFTEDELLCLKVSAYFHNIGMVLISRDLITKQLKHPDQMTAEEIKLFHRHPEYAESLVDPFIGNLKDVSKTIRAAHERWDGTGFPDRLPRENIPKLARYLAIAVYYVESPKDSEETLEEMIGLSGIAFHPETLRLFLKVTEKIKLPEKVEELLFSELEEGRVLAHPLHTPTGLLLYPEDHAISKHSLEKIRAYNNVEPIQDRILVYKKETIGT